MKTGGTTGIEATTCNMVKKAQITGKGSTLVPQ